MCACTVLINHHRKIETMLEIRRMKISCLPLSRCTLENLKREENILLLLWETPNVFTFLSPMQNESCLNLLFELKKLWSFTIELVCVSSKRSMSEHEAERLEIWEESVQKKGNVNRDPRTNGLTAAMYRNELLGAKTNNINKGRQSKGNVISEAQKLKRKTVYFLIKFK